MSYHIVYGVDEGEPIDGPHLASGGGWLAWGDWALGYDDYPECHSLAENGWSDALDALAEELADIATEDGDEDVKAITDTLAKAVAARPAEAASIVITDGTPPGDDDEDEPEEV